MNIADMTKDDLEALQVKKEVELQLAMDALTTVELTDNEKALQVAKIQLERKTLSGSIIQAKHNVRHLASELRNIKTLIWKRLSEGR